MTTSLTHRITSTESKIEQTDIQRLLLLSFFGTVFVGMALGCILITRRANSLPPSRTSSITASDGGSRRRDAKSYPSQALGREETRRSNEVWVVMSVQDPPAPLPTSASPYTLETPADNRDWKRRLLKLDVFAIQDAW